MSLLTETQGPWLWCMSEQGPRALWALSSLRVHCGHLSLYQGRCQRPVGRQRCWCGWEGVASSSRAEGAEGPLARVSHCLSRAVCTRTAQRSSSPPMPPTVPTTPPGATGLRLVRMGPVTPSPSPGRGSRAGEAFLQGQPSRAASSALCLPLLLPDQDNYKELLGAVDNAFLVAYAIGMFIR